MKLTHTGEPIGAHMAPAEFDTVFVQALEAARQEIRLGLVTVDQKERMAASAEMRRPAPRADDAAFGRMLSGTAAFLMRATSL